MYWHEHLRRSAKLAIVGGLHYTGMLGLIRRRMMRDRALILMYHRVNPRGYGAPDYSPVGMSVTPEEFSMQMRFVKRHYDVVPLGKVVEAVRSGDRFAPNLCAITFDDGWEDVYRFAFPILREERVPATIFLTSGFIDGAPWYWEEHARYLLSIIHQRRNAPDFAEHAQAVRAALEVHGLGDLPDRTDAELAMWLITHGRRLKKYDDARRASMLEDFAALAARVAPRAPRPFMNWDEIREMRAAGIEFGNHTVSHAELPSLSDEQLSRELDGAARRIHEAIGTPATDFAYPYGKFDERVLEGVRRTGAHSACTTRFGLVERKADPYALKRINMCSDVGAFEPLFAARVLGF